MCHVMEGSPSSNTTVSSTSDNTLSPNVVQTVFGATETLWRFSRGCHRINKRLRKFRKGSSKWFSSPFEAIGYTIFALLNGLGTPYHGLQVLVTLLLGSPLVVLCLVLRSSRYFHHVYIPCRTRHQIQTQHHQQPCQSPSDGWYSTVEK